MTDLRTDDFDYVLPPELIAQDPSPVREESRLLVVDRAAGEWRHCRFSDIGCFLRSGDVLVLNRTRVIPARLRACKATGGEVELLLLRRHSDSEWSALARPSRRLRAGMTLTLEPGPLRATLSERDAEGQWKVSFDGAEDVARALREAGVLPLPPYIRRSQSPAERYQTVYADRDGSVAAPTAGLHFSHPLLAALRAAGVLVTQVTLHVGPGTFRPVTVKRIIEHQMHAEWGEIPADGAALINEARAKGRRIIAVGTTTTRLLETATSDGITSPFQGETDAFIYPGYQFGAIDGLVTNFHLPRSTLLMLVSAFADREMVMQVYREAIAKQYHFFSFGDAMLLL